MLALIKLTFFLAVTDNFGISTWMTQINAVLTGPVALFIAGVCIIAGAVMFAQGREGHEGLKNLGMIGIAVGILATIGKIWVAFGGGPTQGMHF